VNETQGLDIESQVKSHIAVEGHVELHISQRGLLAGADVRFPSSSSAPLVSNDFDDGIYLYSVFNTFILQKRRK